MADDVDVLARTLYGEARGVEKKQEEFEAIASCILNRVKIAEARGGRYWWGSTVAGVCQKPWQFSCWNKGDLNYSVITTVTDDNPVFEMCVEVAERAVAGELEDPTGGCTHYHTRTTSPKWAKGTAPAFWTADHLFYKGIR